MWKLISFACLFAIFAGSNALSNSTNTTQFMFEIVENNNVKCVGSLVENDNYAYIVTAAHCVYNSLKSQLSVRPMAAENGTATSTAVEGIIVHPYYNPPCSDYDVAILKAKQPTPPEPTTTKPTTTKPMTTKSTPTKPKTTEPTTTEPTMRGPSTLKPPTVIEKQFGKINISISEPTSNDKIVFYSRNSSGKLQEMPATVEARPSCKSKLSKHVTITSKMLCVNHAAPANMSAGSPVIFDNKLAGILSRRFDGSLPSVYTNIANSEILSFIMAYI